MYMMHHRGMEEADDIINELSKKKHSTFISDTRFHNMGLDLKISIKSDVKDIEDRIMMSFCMTDDHRFHKQYVFFGNNSKAFLEFMTVVILNDENPNYENFYTIVTSKDFTSKLKDKISAMSSKITLTSFLDEELMKPPFHAFGAKYSLMTDAELTLFMNELSIGKKEMKKISSKDPIIKYYGFPSGKAVRLTQTPMIEGSLLKTTLDYRIIE
jgi:DNA-directed RNA polymerase subunit H (RpoH/RPB5)